MVNLEKAEAAIYDLLEALGENPQREGLLDTPKRVAKMYQEMFSGLEQDPKEQFTAVFTENHDDVVIVKDIPFIPCVNIIWSLLWQSTYCLFT